MTIHQSPQVQIPAEIDLVLSCARSFVDVEKAVRIKDLVRKGVDWSYAMDMAARQGVLPLLYRNLNRVCPKAVPKDILNQFRNHYMSNLARCLLLTNELLSILNVLDTQGIPTIPFKGPVLSASIYGELELRVFSDLDILIHKEDLLKTKETLESLGYSPLLELPPTQEIQYFGLDFEYAFVHGDTGTMIEIHWSLTPEGYSFSMDSESVWDRAERISFEGRRIRSLAPEDLLLLLCTHGSKHCWERLLWICDIAEVIHHCKSMDWSKIVREVNTSGARRMVALGLFLAVDLLGVSLSNGVLQWVESDPSIQTLAMEVRKNLFQEAPVSSNFFQSKFNSLYHKTMIHPQDRIKHHLSALFTPCSIELGILPLPSSLFFLHPLFRPLRLAAKYWQIFVKRFL